MSISLTAVAFAVLVLLAVALGVVVPDPLGVAVAVGLVVAAAVGLVTPLLTGAVVPLTAVPEPLTVVAFTVVTPDEFTLPEPLLAASTTVKPVAFVRVMVELGATVGVVELVVPVVTGAVVPLTAKPEPLTVAALTVVEPVEFALPEPLLMALTLVEPMALVVVVWARTGLPNTKLSKPALTAVAIVLLVCGNFCIVNLLTVSPFSAFSKNAMVD